MNSRRTEPFVSDEAERSRGAIPPEGPAGRLLAILNAASDRSFGSDELLVSLRDDFSRWNLSPERADFLQPFRELLRGTILCTGSSLGTVARFLGERADRVDAIEPDLTNAALTAARCRDLENVSVHTAGESRPLPDERYDVIVSTPVWDGASSFTSDLKRFRSALRSNGILIASIENSVSLRSLAESEPQDGIRRDEIESVFAREGFDYLRLYCTFPGHGISKLIVTPECMAEPPAGLERVLAAHASHGRTGTSDSGALWKSILEGGLLTSVADAFLIVASAQPLPELHRRERFFIYSTRRRKHFAKATVLEAADGDLAISRKPAFEEEPLKGNQWFSSRSYTEPYFVGKRYLDGLQKIVLRDGWQLEQVVEWAKPWLDLLRASAADQAFVAYIGGVARLSVLPATYVDCVPENILIDETGELQPFDFEYEAVAPIPLAYVVFRGFYYALSGVTLAALPSPSSFPRVIDLVREAMRSSSVPVNEDDVRRYVQIEAALQESVTGTPALQTETDMRSTLLRIHAPGPPEAAESSTAVDAVQLFWRSSDSGYTEAASASAPFFSGAGPQAVSIGIPPLDPAPAGLRLDPCTRPGLFSLLGLRLFNAAGDCIWAWDGHAAGFTTTASIEFPDVHVAAGAIVLSRGGDPNLELPVMPGVTSGLREGGRLEVELSWLSRNHASDEGRALKIIALSRHCEELTAGQNRLRERNARLRETNDRLASEIANVRSELHRLEGQRTADESEKERLQKRIDSLLLTRDESLAVRSEDLALNYKLQELTRVLQEELRAASGVRTDATEGQRLISEQRARIDNLERQLTDICNSRIWRTLVALSSPFARPTKGRS